MHYLTSRASIAALTLFAACSAASAASINWANSATDFNANSSWTGGVAPANDLITDIGVFAGTATNQPSLSADRSINGLSFSSNNWTLGGANTITLGAGGISQFGNNNTITINSNLSLGANLSANISGNNNSSLIINGIISGSAVALTKDNPETFDGNTRLVLNGANTYSGDTRIVSGTIALGNNSALGSSTIQRIGGFGAAAPTLVASGGARTISNQWEGGFTVTGTNDLTLTGNSMTVNGSIDRDWANNSTGKLTLSGALTNSVKRMIIAGSGVTQITGTASNTGNDQGNNDGLIIGDGTIATLVELNKTAGSSVTGGNLSVRNASTARWLNADQIVNTRELRLQGGTADLNGFSETLGLLALSANSTLNLGNSGLNTVSFANSSLSNWSSFILSVGGTFVDGVSLRFGTTSSGLTSGQLAQISIPSFSNFQLNSSGYLTAIPESSTFAALAGLATLGFAACRRRRRS